MVITSKLYCSKELIFGSVYHRIEFNITIERNIWQDMVKWNVDYFGPTQFYNLEGIPQPNQRWYVNGARFLYRDEQDLTWFILNWP
jgi:hypothetical protein